MDEHDHIRELLRERDLRYQQRFDAQNAAIIAAMDAAEKAVDKAEAAAERRFELLNELRDGVATRDQFDALTKVVDVLNSRVDKNEGKDTGYASGWVYLIGALLALETIVTLYLLMGR